MILIHYLALSDSYIRLYVKMSAIKSNNLYPKKSVTDLLTFKIKVFKEKIKQINSNNYLFL